MERCKHCGCRIEKYIEGEPVCADCRSLSEMSPEDVANEQAASYYLTVEKSYQAGTISLAQYLELLAKGP